MQKIDWTGKNGIRNREASSTILNISRRCFTEDDKEKVKSARSVEMIVFSLNCQIYDVLVTIVIAKALPYYPLLCVLTELITWRGQEWSLNICGCTKARVSYQLHWDLECWSWRPSSWDFLLYSPMVNQTLLCF